MPASRSFISVPGGSVLIFSLTSVDPDASAKIVSAAPIQDDGTIVTTIEHDQLFDQHNRLELVSGHRYQVDMMFRFLASTSVNGTAMICKPDGTIHGEPWTSEALPGNAGQNDVVRVTANVP